ncbi:MAG: hypothetical protein K0S98_1829 [Propionibacteriaceae bacterium]|jgi:hypothetical protein|nr:hypothetical protein [Propionibacteriaceae bacterium]
MEQMSTFRLVKLERPGDRVENARGHTAERSALQFGVVLDAHLGESGDLAAAQPRDTTLPNLGQPSLLRGDLGSPQREELADLGPVVHANDGTLQTGLIGMAYQYTF